MGLAKIEIAPCAWRVEFAEGLRALREGGETIEVSEPRTVTAVLTRLAPSVALTQTGLFAAGTLIIIWLPSAGITPPMIERDVEEWMRGTSAERKEVDVRADVRTVRVVWSASRAVIYANEGDVNSALDAIIRFSVAQKEALALEDTMRLTWATIQADLALTHALTLRDLKMQHHVNQMTEVTTDLKIAWLRIFRSFEQLEPLITHPSKRIFAELASAASLYDRMETLEHSVQFALDHYEISNTRLIDMYVAHTDRVNSIYGYGIITVLLLVQIYIMLLEAGFL